jgi:hypothetical protein
VLDDVVDLMYPAESADGAGDRRRRSHVSRVTSKGGTSIAYDRQGGGPAVVLVGGAAVDRSENAPLATELAASFTVSSGGALALEATAAGIAVDRLAVYEVPYDMADGAPQRQRDYVEQLQALLGQGRRGDAFELFMRTVGASDEMVEGARSSPAWPGLEAIAHTLAYDAACMGDNRPPTARLAGITRPTLVATGGASPDSFLGGGGAFFDRAADAIAASIPHAERRVTEGQTHMVDPKVLAPVLERFFAG